ncbi:MAG: hypothetical protein RLO03_13880 [Balneola sp.]
MTKLIPLILLLTTLSGCRQTERITSSRTERIDSVQVSVPIAGHVLDVPVIAADTIVVEDDRVRVTIIPLPDFDLSADPESVSASGIIKNDSVRDVRSGANRYRVIAEVKPDTQQVSVAEKTITETKETVKYERKIPWWGTALIGGLIAIVLVLLVAKKINR